MRSWIDNMFGIVTNVDGEESFWISETTEVHLGIFLSLFGDAQPTYTSLIGTDPENKRGWHEIFKEWQQKGIIK